MLHGDSGGNNDNMEQGKEYNTHIKVLRIVKYDCNVIPKSLICTILLSHFGILLFLRASLSTVLASTVVCSVKKRPELELL